MSATYDEFLRAKAAVAPQLGQPVDQSDLPPLAHLGRALGILAGLWLLTVPATLGALTAACRALDGEP